MWFGIYRRVRRRRRRGRRRRGPDRLRVAGRRRVDALFFLRNADRAITIRGLTITDRIVRPGAVLRRIKTKNGRYFLFFINKLLHIRKR